MANAPPVPPKDTPPRYRVPSSSAPTSANKRKRDNHYETASPSEDERAEYTPKRHRASPMLEDVDPLQTTSTRGQSTLRRKKGVGNLSTLNLRHEAERARLDELQPRESRFQEGSLTDKPSQKPPSAFTRMFSNDASSLEKVDSLMTDYHNGMPTPRGSMDSSHRIDKSEADAATETPSAFYRFGQKLASGFRPVALWNKIWNETKEESTQRNVELEQKRQQKMETEKQYATMKAAGQIPTMRVSMANFGSESHRDSGVAMAEENRLSSFGTEQSHGGGANSRTASTMFHGEHDGGKTIRGRMHFTRPSLSNLRLNLKKTRSEANLFGSSTRESSTSVSPTKMDNDIPGLHMSSSRVDLKKQHKLSKRVSDLERKLDLARRDLDYALVEASPMPKLGSRQDRSGPFSTVRRKFVPGGLPSLPSERLLDAEAMDFSAYEGESNDATIKALRARAYPRHASQLFGQTESQHDHDNTVAASEASLAGDTSHSSITHDNITLARATPPTSDDLPQDAVISVETESRQKQINKKRKSSSELDVPLHPDDSDPANEEEISNGKQPLKRRKSHIAKYVGARSREKLVEQETAGGAMADTDVDFDDDNINLSQHYADEFAESNLDQSGSASVRLSIDSTAHSLQPLYEEEENTSMIALNNDPAKPTAIATPARFVRAVHSMSPAKRAAVVAGVEELVFTRAANAAKQSRSPRKREAFEWPEDVF